MDATRGAAYSGRPYTLYQRVYTRAVSGNSSSYHTDVWAQSNSGYGSYANSASTVQVWVGSSYWAQNVPNMAFAPGDYAGKQIGLFSGDSAYFGHDGNGNLNFNCRAYHPAPGPFNTADTGTYTLSGDRIAAAPGAPGTPAISAINPTTGTATWTAAARGNANIDQYSIHWSTSASFSPDTYQQVGTALTYTIPSLVPGTAYYVRVNAHNSDGWGPYSGTASFTTLPSGVPTIAVTASPSGTGATVTLTAPAGSGGAVTGFRVTAAQTSPLPAPANLVFNISGSAPAPTDVTGLTPGATYSWTAVAIYSSAESGPSSPVVVVQPAPSTNPGRYFDGSTSATADTAFAWTGTTNNSTSTATGKAVSGWTSFSNGVGTSGGTGVVARVTGGYAGTYSARATFFTDATAAGFWFGTDGSTTTSGFAVNAGGQMVGSIFAMPSRSQRLAAAIRWYTSAGVFISMSVGADQLCGASGWTRLVASDTAPSNAAYAGVVVIDVAGVGWLLWRGGESLVLDAAMADIGTGAVTYFDGSSVQDGYTFAWTGTANASTSLRTGDGVGQSPLVDPDCPPVPAPPRPPTVPSDCIQTYIQWNRYWALVPADQVSTWLDTVPTVYLQTGAYAERQVRVRFYPNPFNRTIDQIDIDSYCSEQIVSYLPAMTRLTLDSITMRAWAEVAGGNRQAADQLIYGEDGAPAVWPVLSCGTGYFITMDVPDTVDANPIGNLSVTMTLSERF
jgi:hypothetical protein